MPTKAKAKEGLRQEGVEVTPMSARRRSRPLGRGVSRDDRARATTSSAPCFTWSRPKRRRGGAETKRPLRGRALRAQGRVGHGGHPDDGRLVPSSRARARGVEPHRSSRSKRRAPCCSASRTSATWRSRSRATTTCVGPVKNPYDASRTAGGSTGGGAAAVASGMAAFDWGTDFGGSIRLPGGLLRRRRPAPLVADVAGRSRALPAHLAALLVVLRHGPAHAQRREREARRATPSLPRCAPARAPGDRSVARRPVPARRGARGTLAHVRARRARALSSARA